MGQDCQIDTSLINYAYCGIYFSLIVFSDKVSFRSDLMQSRYSEAGRDGTGHEQDKTDITNAYMPHGTIRCGVIKNTNGFHPIHTCKVLSKNY